MIDFRDKPLKLFVRYIARHKGLFAIDMLCAVLVAAIDLIFPLVSRYSMNELLPKKLYAAFFAVMAALILSFVIKGALSYVITVAGHRMGVLVESDMRRDLFSHLQELSFEFYDKNRTGVLISRVTSDLFDITELAHHGPENIVISGLTMVGALVCMTVIEWRLGLVIALVVPLCLWFTMSQRVRMQRANIEVKRKTANITAAIESGISGIRTAKAFANEQEELRKFDSANALFRSSKNEFYKSMGLFMSGMEFTVSVAQVIVIAVGGFLIMRGTLGYVDLVTFTLYVASFVTPAKKLAQFSEQFMKGYAGFSRFTEIMRTEPQIKDAPDAITLENVRGEISLENVSFSYSNGIPVLRNVDLKIAPGECAAVVGPSGGGKTTLCSLIPRFYDVSEGAVRIDGTDVRKLTQRSLHKNIGIIQQDVFMFAGTVRENIRYGRPDATDAEIVEAAKRAEIHDEIMQLPDGYDSYIGERGVMLSGGQKQRISIARVFLKNPRILIMDEATSALDTVTERSIQSALDELSRGRTTLIVAHRLSTVKNADTIVVIDGEKITEKGTHEQLLAKNGEYAALCRAQELIGKEKLC